MKGSQRKRDYEPVQWCPYFDHSQDVSVGQNTFHIYIKGTEGPLLVLLHGGGYSGLTWAEVTVSINLHIVINKYQIDLYMHITYFRNQL